MKHIILLVDRLYFTGKGTGKEHINETLVKSHTYLFDFVEVLQISKNKITGLSAYCKSLGASEINFIKSFKIYLYYEILKTIGISQSSFREKAILIRDIVKIYRTINRLKSSFSLNGRPSCITISVLGPITIGFCAYYIYEKFNIPYMLWEHRSLYVRGPILNSSKDLLWGKILKNASMVISVSVPLSLIIQKSFPTIKNIEVIPNPVKNDFFGKEVNGNEEIIGFAKGRYIFGGWQNWTRKLKRLDILLKAFQMAKNETNDICLIIVGNVPTWVPQYIIDNNLSGCVYLIGKVSHIEIPSIVKSLNCCVISSEHETFGIQTIEAMAIGIPVITTVCGGPESIITEKKLGRVVPKNRSKDFSEAILDVYKSKDLFEREYITNFCQENYSELIFRKIWKELYIKHKIL